MIESLELSQRYIESIRDATLENSGLPQRTIEELRNPRHDIEEDLHDPDTRLALDIFISCLHASEATYNNITKATARRFPEVECHSHYSIKKLFERATGVVALTNDMCVNGCHAFTDADTNLEECKKCGEHRYDQKHLPKKVPRKTFCTLPLGPQIQALRRSPDRAIAMEYQYDQFCKRQENRNDNMPYDDIQSGSDVQELFETIGLTPNDTTLIFSLDGAQLYQNKQSDTWIAIWILPNYSPKIRYRKKYPKNLDSFLFKENEGSYSRLILLLGTADAVGLTELDGQVGHHGAHGCRLGCTMKGQHKPHSVDMEPDFDFRNPATLKPDLEKYDNDIDRIIGSTTQGEYEENRKNTGLSKLSLLSGLDQHLMLPVPSCFSVDLMHLIFINLGELLIPLWRGTLLCEPSDNKVTWEWAALTGDTWIQHGQLVADATKYFPSSFHRPPRNPAEKISSGYKATEYYLYLFGLGPALFRLVLPIQYYVNFCRLVAAVHIILQRTISTEDLLRAHSLFVQFVEEYENLYYQRRPDRLHMCRPCLHTLLHVAFEVFRKGPGALDSQFTLERTIGDLGSDIRQPSNPFGNLINALYAIVPELDTFQQKPPKGSMDIGGGYLYLRPRDKNWAKLQPAEENLVFARFHTKNVRRWGCILLPTGQVARSMYAENNKKSRPNLHIARNVKIIYNDTQRFAEVQFYFSLLNDGGRFAMVSLYGTQNLVIWEESLHTLYACSYNGQDSLAIIKPENIISLVSMQPLP
ncbi:hypothetical protein BJ165DRAFT_1417414 [Panaeolus papilionaceus]|nr:hypothetical protein BJ165DRAFT_1417414 [Panaeolus papilionaceus]